MKGKRCTGIVPPLIPWPARILVTLISAAPVIAIASAGDIDVRDCFAFGVFVPVVGQ